MSLPGIAAVHVLRRNLRVWSRYWLSNLISNFLEPFLYLLGMGVGLGYYIQSIEDMPYAHFIAPGIVAVSAMFASSFENTYGTYVRLEFQKTFDAMIATPLSVEDVALGELLYGASKSVGYGTFIMLVIEIFGFSPGWRWELLAAPVILGLTGLLFGAIAMIVTSLIRNIDSFNYYITLFITPLFIFSGIFFPLDRLPDEVQTFAWLTPLLHSVRLMRAIMLGHPFPWSDLLWLTVVVILILPLPILLMKRKLIE